MEIGVLGAGVTGQNHVRCYSGMRDVDSVLVYDLNRATSREVAERTGTIACTTAEELLRRVDAVSICVPTPYRHIAAEAALDNDIDMLIEMPACKTVWEALELAGAVPHDLVAGVGHVDRFNPIVAEIEKLVRKPLYVEAKRHTPTSSRTAGTTVVEDQMIHDVDMLGHLFPGVTPRISSSGTPDVCSALMSYGDVPAYLSASRKSSKAIRSIYVEEEDLTFEGDFLSQSVTVYRRPDSDQPAGEHCSHGNLIERVPVDRADPLERELSTFVECVMDGRPFPVTLWDAAATIEVCKRIEACFTADQVRARMIAHAGLARG